MDGREFLKLWANAILLPFVLEAYGKTIHKKLLRLAIEAGLADKNTSPKEGAQIFIQAVKEMKQRFHIGDTVKEIREEDIPKLAHYADKEANPLYPVPVLMDSSELEQFYRKLLVSATLPVPDEQKGKQL